MMKIYFLLHSLLCIELSAGKLGPFTRLSLENGVLVEIAERGAKAPWVRATGEINAPAEKIANLLSDFPRYGEIFSECFASARVLELKHNTARLHIVWRYPIFFNNRDSIARYKSQKHKNGTYQLNWWEDARPGDPAEGIRLNEVEGIVEIIPLGPSQSRVIYRYIGDVGGEFSKTIKEAAWKRQPSHYFHAIIKELEKRAVATPPH